MAQVIQVPVQFTDARDSAKALLDKLKGEISRYKPGTTIANQLIGDTKKLNALLSGLDKKFAKGIMGHSDIDRILTDFREIERAFQSSNKAIGGAKFDELDLNFAGFKTLVTDLQDVQKELNKFAAQKDKIEKMSLGGLLGNSSKIKGMFSSNELSGGAVDFFDKITEDVHKYENALTKAQQKTADLQDSLTKHAALNPNKQVIKNDAWALDLIQKNSSIGDLRAAIVSSITQKQKLSWDSKDNFTEGQLEKLDELLAPFGLDSATVEAAKTEAMTRSKALEQVVNTLTKNPNKHGGPTVKQVEATLKGSKGQAAWDKEQARLQKNFLNAQNQAANAANQIQQARNQLNTVSTALQQNGYLDQNGQKILINEIKDLTNRISTLEAQILQGGRAGIGGTGGLPNDDLVRSQVDARQETENFRRQGQALIKRWFGVHAIVYKVRRAVHQAWSDIQDLDKAMTNIAVVTDMSVSDLWGKINEYMSIAKQYGVTTQGVYEVSQLYYQQGLATAEVMELTTETLKLARVANMDYKDSANAMTVALRGFKMEMSEAATVTDVYSKVAAVTASDQAELAIAMSKTASSAASVGSSLENTTAMLAVMVETTRESAQNLGSALKSIISRYGEMKSGLTQDSEGEIIDYNKVDTALRSVGISIKDAQGQFRDFDDVIFELSEAWGGLDKNTQRYIATIMAGNRQQSRFIALVDNWERLEEVANSAQGSEDAGLLQYAKTLDSLDTKINNLKTSFQEFYMSIVQGPAISKAIEMITKLFEGLNKQGTAASILNVGSIVSTLTIVGTLFVEYFSTAFGKIRANWRATLTGMEGDAARSGQRQAWILEGSNRFGYKKGAGAANIKSIVSKNSALITGVASLLGGVLTTAGTSLTASKENNTGAIMSGIGNALSYGTMGFTMAGPWGALIGAALGGITSVISGWRSDVELEVAELEKATKKAEEANIKRAQSKDEYKTLKDYVDKLKEAQETRDDSAESYQEWLDLNNEIAEKYPELISYIDAEGNSIVNLSDSYEGLAQAKQKALEDNQKYWKAQLEYYEKLINYDRSKEISTHNKQSNLTESVFDEGGNKHALTILSGQITGKRKDVTGQDIVDSAENYLANLYTAEQSGKISKGTYDRVNDLISKRIKDVTPEQVYTDEEISARFALEDGEKDFIGQVITKEVLTYDDLLNTNTDLNPFYNLNAQYSELLKIWDEEIQDFDLSKIEGQTQKDLADSAMAFYYAYQDLFTTDENGQLVMDESAQAIATIQKNQKAWEAAKESYLSSEIALIYSYTDAYESMSDLEGEEALFLAMEKNKARTAGQDFDIYANTLNSDKFMGEEGTGSKVQKFYEGLSIIQQDAFQALLNNLDSFSLPELEKELKDLGAKEEIVSGFQSMYGEQFSGTYKRLAENLINGFNFESFEDWQKTHENETEADYLNDLRTEVLQSLKGTDESLAAIFEEASIEELERYNKLIEDNKRLAENGTAAQQQVANKRKIELTNAFATLATGKGKIFGIDIVGLSEEALVELTALLNAEDIFSYDWGKKIKDFADEYSRETQDIDTLVSENLNTRFESIISGIDDGIKSIEDLGKKQQDGFEFEDAQNISSKLGKDLAEVFEFDKDTGKLVLRNFEDSLNEYHGAIVEEAKVLKEQYSDLVGITQRDSINEDNLSTIFSGGGHIGGFNVNRLGDVGAKLNKYFDRSFFETNDGIRADAEIFDIANVILTTSLDQEVTDAAMQYLKEHTDATWDDFIAWAKLQEGNSQLLLDAAEQAQKTAVRDTNFEEYSKEFEEATRDFAIDQEYFKKYIADETVEDFDAYFENLREVFDFENKRILNYENARYRLIKSGATEKELEDLSILWEEQLASSFDDLQMGEKLDIKGTKDARMALETLLQQMPNTIEAILADGIISAEESLFILERNFDSTKDNNLIDTAARIGADFSEIIENMVTLPGQIVASLAQYGIEGAALTPEMRDVINESRKATFDSMTGLMKGTGTWEEATRLQAMVGKDLEFRETPEGIQLMNESLNTLLLTLKEDNSPLYAETYAEIAKNIQEYYPELENVYDIQEKILELEKDKTVENEEQVRLLKAAANYASNTAGSKGFDFMSSSLAGNAENYLTYIENIGNAQNILKEFASSGKIGAGDFMRMMQFADANGQELPMSWQEIYAAVQTADSEGNISVDVLNELFGDQGALAGIVDLMKKGDAYFRKEQELIQTDRSNTAEYLSGGRDSIVQNWNDITTGKAPLTVRINGETATDANAQEIADRWAALTDFERNEILNTGVWEISTDTTSIIQDAATSLESIDQTTQTIADAIINSYSNSAEKVVSTSKNVEAAQLKLETLQKYGASETDIIKAQGELIKAEAKQAAAIDAFNKAKAEYDILMGKPVTPEVTINGSKLREDIETALKDPFPTTLTPKFIAVPGAYTGNVNGLALAEGTVGKLQQGASLANKTLVGELGPELAVYNGQYHMLGQNGAEFVNLPSNAIVFNHKQTEGIVNGQMGIRGKALSDGTVGPALDLGSKTSLELQWLLSGALGSSTSYNAWDSILGPRSGKGSKTYEFAEQEGEEWYNYLRRIAKLEQEINQLEAERKNIMDGGAYLRNLREVQTIYQEQLITQKQLLEYQKAQLELERKQIQGKWGGALTFTDEGLLQYIFGNEVNGGKGILSLLEAFNKMSGAQQVAAVTGIGYSYTDQNGKKLKGEELVQKFLEELTGDIEHYDDLYDSVADATTELEDFKRALKDIEDEIRDNRIELEEKIYNLVVEGWENNIEKMEEELDILSEANERYINGLSEALEKEKSLYDKNEATADREQLQRRLSLLRRSGGSASEIASLEEQLNNTLKDEYFQHQQEAIDKVAEASQTQIEKMEEQIRIQKEQLEFSKEHGLIWEDVNRILSGSTSEILEFIQGNDSTFIEKSATEIGKQLEEWSKKVGIFTEDRQTQEYTKEATKNFNADTLNSSVFNKASADQKKAYTDMFASYFTNARMDGKSADEAYAHAYDELRNLLENDKDGQDTGGTKGGNAGGTTVEPEKPKERTLWKFTFNGKEIRGYNSEANAKARIESEAAELYAQRDPGVLLPVHTKKVNAIKAAALASLSKYTVAYSKGGLVDYTGLAMVHGSKSRPESFLNAEQTAQITEALRSNGKNSILSDVRQAISEIAAAAKALVMNETNNSSSINVAPGAVVVKVEKLNDKYDINSVADDIMNKMVSIASKATNRGVNRR